MRNSLIASACLMTLGACGGGGGSSVVDGGTGGGPSDRFANPITVQPGEAVPEDGSAFVVGGRAVSATSNPDDTTGTFTSPGAIQVVGSTGDPEFGPDAIRFTKNGVTTEIDFTDVQIALTGSTFVALDSDGTIYLEANMNEEDYPEYVGFGGWGQSLDEADTRAEVIYFGVAGAPTPIASMPTSGSATYRGKSLGGTNLGGEFTVTTSDVTITTPDFRAITFVSENTRDDLRGGVDASQMDFTATGAITGNGFAATGVASGSGMRADGNFYGPNAQEAGGTFNGTMAGQPYGGAFAAKQ